MVIVCPELNGYRKHKIIYNICNTIITYNKLIKKITIKLDSLIHHRIITDEITAREKFDGKPTSCT